MNQAVALETLLARLYTDEALRRAFCAAPREVALAHALDAHMAEALEAFDREGLELMARSLLALRSTGPSDDGSPA